MNTPTLPYRKTQVYAVKCPKADVHGGEWRADRLKPTLQASACFTGLLLAFIHKDPLPE
jgi:hypothetical protein